ncbi:MAG: ABC transporter substrate-binding protein [Methanothrix sp.]|jgi:ABC-type Fe3+-hydroxamate transport system, periplasmic component|uniref:Periplasmic binding protein n=1 Tax=Methanothrix harundinacea TaxID=301375 RepID=A0A117MD00_9EURY|nr:MAG: Periplasmic binding protein [Methanothrix harundinacea]KUK97285.1 MAG: Periplasmic binding protein [Methanothrix harundinacea]MDD3709982.1 ABC transporter substrate-binding protein [Methanothrix sp.]MDD5768544.1 ABC transporter substrate-binding protein [Methanothrix sp.]MDI9398020.1 ABC transporter substrate-binding protein [Euryarchaeota archaeon]
MKLEVVGVSGKRYLFIVLILAANLLATSAALDVPVDLDDGLEDKRQIFESYPRAVADSTGNVITIYKPLERVVVLNKAAAEVMRSLEAEDLIVAVDQNTAGESVFFPELSGLPSVGSLSSPDTEAVLEQRPDAVIHYATVMVSGGDQLRSELGSVDPSIAMIRLDLSKPESYVQEVQSLAHLIEREEEAREYLGFYNASTIGISERVDDLDEDEKPRVYLEIWGEYKTASSSSASHQKLAMAGGENIFENLSVTYPVVDPEKVIVEDPDVIIKLCGAGDVQVGGYGADDLSEMEALRDGLLSRPGWGEISAVKEGRVYVISNDVLSGAKHFIGVAYMAKVLHPELFEDLDPVAEHQEYLTRFQRLDYDLGEHGAFIYPPIEA